MHLQSLLPLVPASLLALSTSLAAQTTKAPPVKTGHAIKAETFAKGLVHPWGLAFLPDGRLLVTERPGRLRIVGKDGMLSAALQGVPKVYASGQGGLLDVQLGPDFATSSLIYLSYADPRDGSRNGTSVARAKFIAEGDGGRLDSVQVIFRQEPAYASSGHFGSRLVFTQRRVAVRDVGRALLGPRRGAEPRQSLGQAGADHAGRQPLRWQSEEGRVAARRSGRSAIATAGRGAQPGHGQALDDEHGARGGDEINIPEAGKNYGWPVISYGRDYDFTTIGIGTHKAGMEQPRYYWDPSIAPSGAAFYTGDLFAEWKGNLFVGALAGQALHRLVLDGEKGRGRGDAADRSARAHPRRALGARRRAVAAHGQPAGARAARGAAVGGGQRWLVLLQPAPPQLLLAVERVEAGRRQDEDAGERQGVGQLVPDQEAEQDRPDDAGVAEGSDGRDLARAQREDHAQVADEREHRGEDQGEELDQARHLPGFERPAAKPASTPPRSATAS